MTELDIGIDCSTHHVSMGILSSAWGHAETWEVGANPRGSKAADRFAPLMREVGEAAKSFSFYDQRRVYIEDVPYVAHGKVPVNKAALIDLAQVTGGVAALFLERGFEVQFVNNQTWKAHFGFGHSDVKGQIAQYVELAWLRDINTGVLDRPSGKPIQRLKTGREFKISQDLADALCIVEYGRSLHRA